MQLRTAVWTGVTRDTMPEAAVIEVAVGTRITEHPPHR